MRSVERIGRRRIIRRGFSAQLVHRWHQTVWSSRGEGWGCDPGSWAREDQQDKGGCSQHPPFFFADSCPDAVQRSSWCSAEPDPDAANRVPVLRCITTCCAASETWLAVIVHLHRAGKAAYLNRYASKPTCKVLPLESQSYSSPVEPPDAPHEPMLTLPGALTAYVLLIAAIHLRVLLPVELENWTIDVFGFIPKRYDSTLAQHHLSRRGRRQGLDLRHLFPAACQSQPYRLQRAVAAAVRQRAGAPVRCQSGSSHSWR